MAQNRSEIQVFICYAREDHAVAERLYHDLERAGVSPWLDRKKLLPGQNWKIEIRRAMEKSAYVLVVLSTNSVSKRGYVQKELKKALDILDEFPSSTIYLIPVRVDECEPIDERLQDLHWVNLFPDYKDGLRQILRVLVPDHTPKLPQPLRVWIKMILPVGIVILLLLVGGIWGPDIIQRFRTGPTPTPTAALTLTPTSIPTVTPTVKPPTPTPVPTPTKSSVTLLRSKPGTFSVSEIGKVVQENSNFPNEFEEQTLNGDKVVIDHISGLMWQQGGSSNYMSWQKAQDHVDQLNRDQYAGFSDWRLPTMEELASLLEPEKQSNKLYIHPMFDGTQKWCWSADKYSGSWPAAWNVSFDFGLVYWSNLDYEVYVRAVRSRQS